MWHFIYDIWFFTFFIGNLTWYTLMISPQSIFTDGFCGYLCILKRTVSQSPLWIVEMLAHLEMLVLLTFVFSHRYCSLMLPNAKGFVTFLTLLFIPRLVDDIFGNFCENLFHISQKSFLMFLTMLLPHKCFWWHSLMKY